MDKLYYEEMVRTLKELFHEDALQNKRIYLFGHCNATEQLIDLMLEQGLNVISILDNNKEKHKRNYRNIPIEAPKVISRENADDSIVCIAARAYEAMKKQLRELGYTGAIRKMVEYNSYAEYSLSEATIEKKYIRVRRGIVLLEQLKQKYRDCYCILCPFAALGDIYFVMSYLPYFLKKRNIKSCVIAVIGKACSDVVRLFGAYQVAAFSQRDMEELIQAALYIEDAGTFIPHQDRPYVVDLSKALYAKRIPLEQLYCCGVFGLPLGTKAYKPVYVEPYEGAEKINKGRAVILSPYAKSVTAIADTVWYAIVKHFQGKGFQCFTNVVGDEKALPDTIPLNIPISQIQSAVEQAGVFVGIRSGLCDVLREANAQKIALYPDYNYCDTCWKAIEMYEIAGWENILIKESGADGK